MSIANLIFKSNPWILKYVVGNSVQVMTQFGYANIGRFEGNKDISVEMPSNDVRKALKDICYILLVLNIGWFPTKFNFYQLPIRSKF